MDKLSAYPTLRMKLLAFFMIVHVIYNPANSEAVTLTEKNLNKTLASNEIVFINFYAKWIHSSNVLTPVFDDAADILAREFPDAGKVVLGKVNGDEEYVLASRFHITQYLTLKLFRNGQPVKKHYKGQQSTKAFIDFIKKELEDPIQEFKDLKELNELESNKRIVIGYFDKRDQPEYNIFRRVATNVKDDCQFHVGFDKASKIMHPSGQPVVVFRPDKDHSNDLDETFNGSLTNFDELHSWIANHCVPLIREMTMENMEDLSEEGLKLLTLFHDPDDEESVKRFTEVVQMELSSEKDRIAFLTADGKKFAQLLEYLGKRERKSDMDLPLIALDSFKHIYFFPNFKDIEISGKLNQFIQDLYSGKLHREYHYGPDQDYSKTTLSPENTSIIHSGL